MNRPPQSGPTAPGRPKYDVIALMATAIGIWLALWLTQDRAGFNRLIGLSGPVLVCAIFQHRRQPPSRQG